MAQANQAIFGKSQSSFSLKCSAREGLSDVESMGPCREKAASCRCLVLFFRQAGKISLGWRVLEDLADDRQRLLFANKQAQSLRADVQMAHPPRNVGVLRVARC